MVRTLPSSTRGEEGLTPGWGAKILHAAWPPPKKTHRSDIETNSIKTLQKMAFKKKEKERLKKKGKKILKQLLSPVCLLLC